MLTYTSKIIQIMVNNETILNTASILETRGDIGNWNSTLEVLIPRYKHLSRPSLCGHGINIILYGFILLQHYSIYFDSGTAIAPVRGEAVGESVRITVVYYINRTSLRNAQIYIYIYYLYRYNYSLL